MCTGLCSARRGFEVYFLGEAYFFGEVCFLGEFRRAPDRGCDVRLRRETRSVPCQGWRIARRRAALRVLRRVRPIACRLLCYATARNASESSGSSLHASESSTSYGQQNLIGLAYLLFRALAELELGPSSRNISGARRAADRLVRAARAQRTAPARRAS